MGIWGGKSARSTSSLVVADDERKEFGLGKRGEEEIYQSSGGDISPLFSTRSMFVFRPAESGLFVETGMGVVSLRPGFWDFLCEFPENNIKKAETQDKVVRYKACWPAWLCIREPRRNAQTRRQTGGGGGGGGQKADAPFFCAANKSLSSSCCLDRCVVDRREHFFSLFPLSEGVCLVRDTKQEDPHVFFFCFNASTLTRQTPFCFSFNPLSFHSLFLRNLSSGIITYFLSFQSSHSVFFFFNHLLHTNNSCVSWLAFFFLCPTVFRSVV